MMEMKKRGQEGVTLTTLLLIILGAVVVVVVILGATGSLNFIFDKIKIAPGQDLEAVAQSCKIAASTGLRVDYCITFKEIKVDDVKEYVNCQDIRIQSSINPKPEFACETGDNDPSLVKCKAIVSDANYDGKAKINGGLIPKNAVGGTSPHTFCKQTLKL